MGKIHAHMRRRFKAVKLPCADTGSCLVLTLAACQTPPLRLFSPESPFTPTTGSTTAHCPAFQRPALCPLPPTPPSPQRICCVMYSSPKCRQVQPPPPAAPPPSPHTHTAHPRVSNSPSTTTSTTHHHPTPIPPQSKLTQVSPISPSTTGSTTRPSSTAAVSASAQACRLEVATDTAPGHWWRTRASTDDTSRLSWGGPGAEGVSVGVWGVFLWGGGGEASSSQGGGMGPSTDDTFSCLGRTWGGGHAWYSMPHRCSPRTHTPHPPHHNAY